MVKDRGLLPGFRCSEGASHCFIVLPNVSPAVLLAGNDLAAEIDLLCLGADRGSRLLPLAADKFQEISSVPAVDAQVRHLVDARAAPAERPRTQPVGQDMAHDKRIIQETA